MVKYKIYGLFALFVFSFPKIQLSNSTTLKENIAPAVKENIAAINSPVPPEISSIAIRKVPVTVKRPKKINVTASVYFPVECQTDSSPLVTADNSKINSKMPKKHRWIAVSRNLLRRWGGTIDYGDTLNVKGISKAMDGHYVVRDTMNKRIKNQIDILVGQQDKIMGYWQDVEIHKLN